MWHKDSGFLSKRQIFDRFLTFIHSEKDYRCTLANGLEMFAALKLHGVETRLCMFFDEDHGLSRTGKPSNRICRMEEILNWLNSHLKEDEI